MAFTLPPLPYAYDALAPFMSKETLEFHHDKHHNAYVTTGNTLAGDGTKYAGKSIEEICVDAFMAKDHPVINNIGQIERGYEKIDARLRALGAQLERVDD